MKLTKITAILSVLMLINPSIKAGFTESAKKNLIFAKNAAVALTTTKEGGKALLKGAADILLLRISCQCINKWRFSIISDITRPNLDKAAYISALGYTIYNLSNSVKESFDKAYNQVAK